jgi:membrane protein required for colicin V production
MNYLDIIIVVLLLAFGIGGWRKGVILELTTLLGLGLGLYGAFHFCDFTANKLVEYVEIDPKYLHLISFIVTFIVAAILVNLLGRLISKAIRAINLGSIDKLGGFLVGLAKGLLICSLLVMLLNVLDLKGVVKDDAKQKSLLYPYVEQAVPYVYQGFDIVKEAVSNQSGTTVDDVVGQTET